MQNNESHLIDNASVSSLLLMSSVKKDTQEHRVDLKDINGKVERLENKVDRLEESMQQLNLAITTLANSQMQTHQKVDTLFEQTHQKMDKLFGQTHQKMDTLSDKLDKLWNERWLYRIFPLSILSLIGIGIWQLISNWDSISTFFNAMNDFFQSH